MNSHHNNEPTLFERLLATGSYLTMGTVGMVWFLLNFLIIKKPMKRYLMLNIMQSFILSILYAILTLAYNIVIDLLGAIPFIGKLFIKIHVWLFLTPVFSTLSLVNYILLLFFIYLSILALFGNLPYVPYITNAVKKMV